jgi:hypothetical protein
VNEGIPEEATEAGAAIMEGRFSLPRVVRFAAAAFRADDLAVTSFTAISFRLRAFTGFFFAPEVALEGMREYQRQAVMGEAATNPPDFI